MIEKIAASVLLLITLQGVLGESQSIEISSNEFSMNLYKISNQDRAANEHKNLGLSGFSAYVVMLMMYNGANGHTEDQLQSGLLLKNSSLATREILNTDQKNLIERITSDTVSQLILANKIFVDNSITLKSEFKNIIESNFKSVPENVNFEASDNASNIINSWIEKETNSSITHVVNPGDFSSDTKVVLVNAIDFKGKWLYPFDADSTSPQPFNLGNGITKNVPTMRRRMLCGFGPLSQVDAEFIILPFQEEDTVMMIILPEEQSGVDNVLRNLHNIKIKNIIKDSEKSSLAVSIPKFKIETETNLVEPMKKLGMTDMFLSSANFSRISDDPLAVDKIIQKVNIEVNEMGSSASGATALSIENRSMAEEYEINRPFLFWIVTKGLVIFSGVITDPSQK